MIKSKLKYLFAAILGFLLLAVVFMILLWPKVENVVIQKIIALALQQNIQLQLEKPNISWLGFEADQLNIRAYIKKIPLILNAEKMRIKSEIWPLLKGRISQQTSFELYGGNAKIQSLARSRGKLIKAEFEISNVSLPDWPSFQMLGLKQGYLNISANKIDINAGKIKGAEYKFQLNDLAKETETFIGPRLSSLPFELRLPPFRRLSLQGEGNLGADYLEISKLNLNGDFGSYFMKARFSADSKIISMEGRAELSSIAQTILGPFLPLISSGELTEESRVFAFRFRGYSSGLPLFSYTER